MSTKQVQACSAGACLAHTRFSVFGLSPSLTPAQDALGSLGDLTEGCLFRHGDGRKQMPRVHNGKVRHGWKQSRLGVCLVRAYTLCFIEVL